MMEALRRQIDDEATMITMIDEHLVKDQHELDTLNDEEAIRAEQVWTKEKAVVSILNYFLGATHRDGFTIEI
jgi:hypothetical protein